MEEVTKMHLPLLRLHRQRSGWFSSGKIDTRGFLKSKVSSEDVIIYVKLFYLWFV